MKNNKLRWLVLLPTGLFFIYALISSSQSLYSRIIEFMPETARGWYCSYLLRGDGFLSSESEKTALLSLFVHHKNRFPASSYKELYDIAIKYEGDPIGIMALHIAFDSTDKNLICMLWATDGFRDSFLGKLEVYRESGSPNNVAALEEIIASCAGN